MRPHRVTWPSAFAVPKGRASTNPRPVTYRSHDALTTTVRASSRSPKGIPLASDNNAALAAAMRELKAIAKPDAYTKWFIAQFDEAVQQRNFQRMAELIIEARKARYPVLGDLAVVALALTKKR